MLCRAEEAKLHFPPPPLLLSTSSNQPLNNYNFHEHMKILSIIVPSYNMEAYLPKCLGSLEVARELMEQLEVFVVNDGSKDRTSEIAHEFEVRYPGVFRVIDKPNGNYGSCINAALPLCTGVFVKVLDASKFWMLMILLILLG